MITKGESALALQNQVDLSRWNEVFDAADALDGSIDEQIFYEDLEEALYNRILNGIIDDEWAYGPGRFEGVEDLFEKV